MPLVNRTFDQLINFTRTTAGTFVGSNGLIQSTPQSRNLLTFTEEFDNAAWAKVNVTVTANSAVAPDGTNTADLIVPTVTNAQHRAEQNTTIAAATHTFSVFVKDGGYGFVWLRIGVAGAIFDIATGATSSINAGVTATSEALSNGWRRCIISCAALGNDIVRINPSTSSSVEFAGNGTSGIFLWGAQLEIGSTATDYTRNFGGRFPPRFDFDPVSLAPRGLLIEEQRTNLVLRSEEFDNVYWGKQNATVTANATTSPAGAVNADALIENTASGVHGAFALPGLGVNTYTMSFFAKANGRTQVQVEQESGGNSRFTLTGAGAAVALGGNSVSITPFGDGWYRCTTTFTVTGGFGVYINLYNGTTVSYTGNGTSGIFIWGAQLEAGAFATSYIPTVASQVTRTADVATIAAPNFASWYNQTEGTMVVEASVNQAGSDAFLWATNNVGAAQIAARRQANNTVIGYNRIGGNNDVNAAGTWTTGIAKIAYAIRSGDQAVSTNGGAVAVNTTSTFTQSPDRLNIGNLTSSGFLNGHIRSIRYFPVRLSNAQLQALTA